MRRVTIINMMKTVFKPKKTKTESISIMIKMVGESTEKLVKDTIQEDTKLEQINKLAKINFMMNMATKLSQIQKPNNKQNTTVKATLSE